MPGRFSNRRVAIASDRSIKPTTQERLDPATIEPDTLRDRIYEGLTVLAPDKRAALRDCILAGIDEGGEDIGSSLLMLGIPAKTPDELTPYDIAKLVRYIRLNAPQVLIFLVTPLSELLTAANSVCRIKQSRRAA